MPALLPAPAASTLSGARLLQFAFHFGLIIKALQRAAGNGALGKPLDAANFVFFLRADQGKGGAALARAGGAASPVNIILSGDGHIKIDHVAQRIHVDAACGDVGGDQHPVFAALEA